MNWQKRFKWLMENQPETFAGTRAQWRKLVREMVEPPDPKRPWTQDGATGEWTRREAA